MPLEDKNRGRPEKGTTISAESTIKGMICLIKNIILKYINK